MAEWGLAVAMAALLATVAGVTLWQRRRGNDPRPVAPADLGPFPRVLLFTSDDCASCPPARDLVAAATAGRFDEYTWQVHPGTLRRLRVEKVPTTWVVDRHARVEAVFEGVPDEGALRRALGRASEPGR